MKCYWKMNFKVGTYEFKFAVNEQSFLGLCTIFVQDQVFFLFKKTRHPFLMCVYDVLSIRIGKTQNRTRKIYSQLSFNVVVICYSY